MLTDFYLICKSVFLHKMCDFDLKQKFKKLVIIPRLGGALFYARWSYDQKKCGLKFSATSRNF